MDRRALIWSIPFIAGYPLLLGCEEYLPAYVEPEIILVAYITVSSPLTVGDLMGGGLGEFGLDIRNISEGDDVYDYVLFAPFEVVASVTVYHAEHPTRNIIVSGKEMFDEDLGHGQAIRVTMRIPTRDSNNLPWNAHDTDTREHEIVFQGKATIEKIDMTLNTQPRSSKISYF